MEAHFESCGTHTNTKLSYPLMVDLRFINETNVHLDSYWIVCM